MFSELSERLALLGEQLRTGSVPDIEGYTAACKAAREGFERLRLEALDASAATSVAAPPEGFQSLEDLASWLPGLRAVEVARGEAESSRRQALAVLDRVERLGCPSDPGFAPLADCREQARSLRESIASGAVAELPGEARRLIEGTHPLAVLLKLLAADESTGDALWADWYDAVASALGNPLAVAVARGRVKETPA